MTITTFSSREFNQDTGRAKRASAKGPVFITYRGRPAYVLLSFEEYRRLSVQPLNIVEALSMTGLADIAFEPPRLGPFAQVADLS